MEKILQVEETNQNIKHVLLVDDNHSNFIVLKSFFNRMLNNISIEYASFEQAQGIIRKNKFDLIMMELSFPDFKAFLLGNELIKQHPQQKILLTTLHNDPWLVQVAYNLKFHGYFRKQSDIQEMLNAMSSLFKGENYFDKEVIEFLNQTVEPRDYYFRKLNDDLKDVYRLLVRAVAIPIIAKKLNISEEKVHTKTKQILNITNTKSVVELIVFNYKKEVNSLMSFEEMMRFRVKSFIPTEPLYKTLGLGFKYSN